MRPLHLVLDRIRWDARVDPARFAVRWLERGGGARVEALPAFLARKDVPLHRVRSLSCDGRVVWDRDAGVDDVDGAFAGVVRAPASAAPALDGALFWNVRDVAAEGGAEDPARLAAVAAFVAGVDVDVVALVEVSDALAALLGGGTAAFAAVRGARAVFRHGSLALVLPAAGHAWTAQPLPLPGRDALLCTTTTTSGDGAGGGIAVAVAHLTSSARGDRSARREEQLQALAAALPARGPLLVLLDANSVEPLAPLDALGLVDLGRDAGGTFAADGRRIDRIFARDVDAICNGAVRVARDVDVSDHWPLVVARARPARANAAAAGPRGAPARTSVRANPGLALAVLPPPEVAAALDVVRAAHDPAFARWPAHVTIAFPFVDDAAADDAVRALQRAAVHVAPFRAAVDGTGAFVHARETITWARVDASEEAAAGFRALFALVDLVSAPAPQERAERTAHLTIARTKKGAAPPPADALDRVPAAFDVRALALLRREAKGGRYDVVDAIPLGRASLAQAIAETGLVDESEGWRAAFDLVRARLPGHVALAGSSKRGVRFVDSDLDLSWTPPPSLAEDPLAFALAALGGTRVDTQSAPRISTTLAGVDVDVVLDRARAGPPAPPIDDVVGAIDEAHRAEHARAALVALRVWARRRRIDKRHPDDGRHMPASAAWAGLVEEATTRGDRDATMTAAQIVRLVWARLADDHDVGAVSGTGFRSVTPKTLGRVRQEAARAAALVAQLHDDDAPWRAVLTAPDRRSASPE